MIEKITGLCGRIERYWSRPSRRIQPTAVAANRAEVRKLFGNLWASGGDSRTYPSVRWCRPLGQGLAPY